MVVNVGRELSLLTMAIDMANADYPSFFLWNELEPRCQQRAAGSLELLRDKLHSAELFDHTVLQRSNVVLTSNLASRIQEEVVRVMELEYESDLSEGDDFGIDAIDPERDPRIFYLIGKLAPDLPREDTQASASLYRAVCEEDLATVKSLLENDNNPNLPYYYLPKKKLNGILGSGLGVSIEDERGMFHYPLHRAVLLNKIEFVELLLDHFADPNAVDGRSNTPLAMLIKSNELLDCAIAEKLIQSGADKDAALYTACHGDDDIFAGGTLIKWPVVKTLLQHGADLRKLLIRNEHSFLNIVTQCGWSQNDKETAYEVLSTFLDTGLDGKLLKTAVEEIMFFRSPDTLRQLTLLLQVGVQVDF